MDKELIEKYNVSVPRYTSYPPANYFTTFDQEMYLEAIAESNRARQNNISFYIHMPFCRQLCHYCGCNSYPMQRDEQVKAYIEALHHEIDLVATHIDSHRKISQIHYGGGSPTAMPVKVLHELNDHLLSLFPTIDKPEIAIECHPGYLSHRDWEGLVKAGFNRFSLGIQDFDETVLKVVNRVPAMLPIEEIMAILREAGANINMDFLFGLPRQTPDSFNQSIERAAALRPDRVTTFSYGHCPWIFKRQLILEKAGLPTPEDKALMFQNAKQTLHEAGYVSVGLDHFVLPGDELATALTAHQLHRNFQGYCTRRTTGQVYAFGVTGISQLDTAYAQNTKSIEEYVSTIAQGRLPVSRGYRLSHQERVVREVIEMLMCNYRIDWNVLAAELKMNAEEIKQAVRYDEAILADMQADGVLHYTADSIVMTGEGNPFVRNVAAALDPLMSHTTKKFSKPI